MRSKPLYVLAAAALFGAGAAYAQTDSAADPATSAAGAPPPATADSMHDEAMKPGGDVKPMPMDAAPAAGAHAMDSAAVAPGATVSVQTVTNGPVPDTEENRAKYGQPLSNAGKRTAASGD